MPETAPRRSHRRFGPFRAPERLGEDALRFARWYGSNKFALMAGFLGELERAPDQRDPAELRDRFCRALLHGRRVLLARGVVTFLLALGIVATLAAGVARAVDVPAVLEGDVAYWRAVLERGAAVAAAFSAVLLALRLAFDRYLDLVETSATFLAIQLATTRPPPRA